MQEYTILNNNNLSFVNFINIKIKLHLDYNCTQIHYFFFLYILQVYNNKKI